VTEEFLRATFAAPAWVNTRVEPARIAAEPAEGKLSLPALLLRTERARA